MVTLACHPPLAGPATVAILYCIHHHCHTARPTNKSYFTSTLLSHCLTLFISPFTFITSFLCYPFSSSLSFNFLFSPISHKSYFIWQTHLVYTATIQWEREESVSCD